MARGIKTITIIASSNYSIVNAYEFEHLKTEKIMQEIFRPCTLYLIVQRPLMYIQNLFISAESIDFEICDDSENKNLKCKINLAKNEELNPDGKLKLEIGFYKENKDSRQPFNDVAALKFFDNQEDFIAWYTPQKLIYAFFQGEIDMEIDGDPVKYIDYKVHYIGQAFDQSIWDRLTGHEKLQKIMTIEDIISQKALKNSYEISIILLDIQGYDEENFFPWNESFRDLFPDVDFIFHELEADDEFVKFNTPSLDPKAAELTNEVEAMMIHKFKPEYNKIHFKNYPGIKSGTRGKGYSAAKLVIQKLPVILSTDSFKMQENLNNRSHV